uniref:Uncharacterized protein n=1 Tax=Romanomermis culicivorax TaxID=13658 RepID=A0A915KF03_ROMCU
YDNKTFGSHLKIEFIRLCSISFNVEVGSNDQNVLLKNVNVDHFSFREFPFHFNAFLCTRNYSDSHALVSVVRNRAKIDRTSDHLANFRPVYGFDGDISTIASSSKNNAQFSAKYSSLIDGGVGKSANFNLSGLFSRSDASKPYEIKSCLSPDLQVHEEATCRFFAIMMDAGSTGTRVHIFEFSHNVHDKSAPFKLEREIYDSVSPGLSYYLTDPNQAANSILPLLKRAESVVSKSQWVHTPLALKATAGLRLLDAPKADAIIETVDNMFDGTSFLTNEDSVSIMTGIDEGIFGWFTLNFLLERLSSIKYEKFNEMIDDNVSSSTINPSTAAALDLGGGSTQITFKPKLNATLQSAPANYIKQIRLFSKTVNIYTHSYLGNGLMASRLQSLQLANDGKNGSNLTHFTSLCLPPTFSLLWMYNDVTYNVSGSANYSFDSCLQEQTNFTNKTIVNSPVELKSQDIYIFGYFFDRAYQAGLTGTNGGYATVQDFIRAAKKGTFCENAAANKSTKYDLDEKSELLAIP